MSKIKRFFLSFFFLFTLLLIFGLKKEKIEKKIEVYSQTPFTYSKNWSKEPDLILVDKTSLRSFLPPSFVENRVLSITQEPAEERKEIIEYFVEEGDTIFSLAEKFNISLETILWANDLNKNSIIKPGQKLIILPISGLLHQVKPGDTISEIAQKYQAKVDEIVAFNELESPDDIYVGDFLIIPNGKMPQKTKSTISTSSNVPISNGYFLCPVAGGCRITQGLHWYNAVDFSNGQCGEPILASAGGTVQKAKYGWNGGAGSVITILHPNGVITMYGHLQKILVSSGQQVLPGEMIGLMGSTGKSTGCHLHFAVYGAKNPFAR